MVISSSLDTCRHFRRRSVPNMVRPRVTRRSSGSSRVRARRGARLVVRDADGSRSAVRTSISITIRARGHGTSKAAGQGAGLDRALPVCPGVSRRFGRRAAAPGRRDRLRLHAQYALQPDRRLQDHPQLHHHAGERDRRRLDRVGGLRARKSQCLPARTPCVPHAQRRTPCRRQRPARRARSRVGRARLRLLVHTMAPTLGRR